MNINKFEKVSFEQFKKDALKNTIHMSGIREINIAELEGVDLKEVYDKITLPKRSTKISAGYDFVYPFENIIIRPTESIMFPTGIKVRLNDDKVLKIYPRSGHGFKYRIQLDNTVGVIDADYYNNPNNEGHIMVKITNDGKFGAECKFEQGKGICQGVIEQYFVTCDDEAEGERVGGFGSTDCIKPNIIVDKDVPSIESTMKIRNE